MRFALDDQQQAVTDAVAALLRRHAGPARARAVGPGGHDDELFDALAASGFLDLAAADGAGPLSAALLVEAVSAAAGRIHAGARCLVAPGVLGDPIQGRVCLAVSAGDAPVRFGAHAETMLVLDGDDARLVENPAGRPVNSPFQFPYAVVSRDGGRKLRPGAGELLRRWWQASLAGEIAGAASAALNLTVTYLGDRVAFGRPLATLQAIQHRCAEAKVFVEGASWLARAAAWSGADPELAAAAAAYAAEAAAIIVRDMHQLTGAMGFTYDYDLHLWTLRLQGLRLELQTAANHRRDLADARWRKEVLGQPPR